MPDYVVTAANVLQSANATTRTVTAGEAITAGQPVYKDDTDSKHYVADVDDANKYKVVGIALNDANGDGIPFTYVEEDPAFTTGFTMAIGDILVLSADGAISPSGDLTTGDYAVILGVATSTTTAKVKIDSNNRADAVIA